jgi:hypothetical protein
VKIGEKFIIRTQNKKIVIRKEKDFFISFDPQIFEIIKFNNFAGELLYYISLNINYDLMMKVFELQYNQKKDVIENSIYNFLEKYPSYNLIKNNLKQLGFKSL